MPYIMVPVPEEHVTEAMQLVIRLVARASVEPWDEASITALFAEVDEASRFVLSAVARGTIAKGQISDSEVARAIELGQREILGITRELNETATKQAHPPLISVQSISETLPNGRVKEQRVLAMPRDIADIVRIAERSEQTALPHPLIGGAD